MGLMVAFYPLKSQEIADNFKVGTPTIESMSQITFSPEGILFIGDSKAAKIIALDLDDKVKPTGKLRLGVRDLEGKIADLLGSKKEDILVHDVAVNPMSLSVYLAVSRGRAKGDSFWKMPNDLADATILIRVKSGNVFEAVSFKNVRYSEIAIPNPVNREKKNWRGKLRTDVITDIAYANNHLYVAGLSNEEFSSTFRKIPYPFEGKVTSASIEIYHGAHGHYETKAPIRAFMPYKLNGKDHILAAYLCTPLVTIPEEKIQSGKQVKGRTVAELGIENFPLDMLVYNKNGKDYILMANTTRNAMRIAIEDIEKSKESITKPVKSPYLTAGVKYASLAIAPQQIAKFNDKYVLMVRRFPNGSLVMHLLANKQL